MSSDHRCGASAAAAGCAAADADGGAELRSDYRNFA